MLTTPAAIQESKPRHGNPEACRARDALIHHLSSSAVFHLSRRSLLRGNLLVLGSFGLSFLLSGFPHSRATLLLLIPTILAFVGLADTFRCSQTPWGFYHGGVILLLLMDMMAICLILFFLLYPYLV
jgi:hypothetical protein